MVKDKLKEKIKEYGQDESLGEEESQKELEALKKRAEISGEE